ncbi:MAG TPA: hypothetical protein VGB79_05300 [Allosphingosinicella sp.]|jgi:hypothetical protein
MRVILSLAAMLQPYEPAEFPTEASQPYRCSVSMTLDGLRGGMWRDFIPGRPDEYYQIQFSNPAETSGGPFVGWSVDNRPPARPSAYGWSTGRPEATAFRYGPNYVYFGTIRYGRMADGAISARLLGDGVLAGTVPAQRAKLTRQVHRLGGDGLTFSIHFRSYPEIFARLAGAATWEAVLLDAAGRELGRKSVRVPSPAAAEAEFNRARAELLRHRDGFLLRPTWNRDKPCATQVDELDSPI